MTDEITLVPVCSWNDLLLLNVATYILSYLLCCFILVCSRAVTTVSTQSVPNSVKNAPAKCDIKDSLCSLLTVLYRSFYPLTCNQIQLIQIKKKRRKFRVCSACLWVDETIVVVYSAWSLINCMLHSFIPLFFFERPARWDFKNEGCIRYQQSITRFVETSPQSFPRVTLENRAQAITIHQPEIMRAHKVHSKDTATHSLSQDRHKGMLLPGKPSDCFLPRGCTVLNNAYLKT